MEKIKVKISELAEVLRQRGNPSHIYYENVLSEIDENPKEILSQLRTSYAITQYANFTRKEELLLSDLISEITTFMELPE